MTFCIFGRYNASGENLRRLKALSSAFVAFYARPNIYTCRRLILDTYPPRFFQRSESSTRIPGNQSYFESECFRKLSYSTRERRPSRNSNERVEVFRTTSQKVAPASLLCHTAPEFQLWKRHRGLLRAFVGFPRCVGMFTREASVDLIRSLCRHPVGHMSVGTHLVRSG